MYYLKTCKYNCIVYMYEYDLFLINYYMQGHFNVNLFLFSGKKQMFYLFNNIMAIELITLEYN